MRHPMSRTRIRRSLAPARRVFEIIDYRRPATRSMLAQYVPAHPQTRLHQPPLGRVDDDDDYDVLADGVVARHEGSRETGRRFGYNAGLRLS